MKKLILFLLLSVMFLLSCVPVMEVDTTGCEKCNWCEIRQISTGQIKDWPCFRPLPCGWEWAD